MTSHDVEEWFDRNWPRVIGATATAVTAWALWHYRGLIGVLIDRYQPGTTLAAAVQTANEFERAALTEYKSSSLRGSIAAGPAWLTDGKHDDQNEFWQDSVAPYALGLADELFITKILALIRTSEDLAKYTDMLDDTYRAYESVMKLHLATAFMGVAYLNSWRKDPSLMKEAFGAIFTQAKDWAKHAQ